MNWKLALIVAAGGALGTLGSLRPGAGLMAPFSQSLPWGTIAINIMPARLVIGFTAAQTRYPLSEAARLFVMVGLCGGFTTFSAFSLQTFDLLRVGAYGTGGGERRGVARRRVSRRSATGLCVWRRGLASWLA